MFPAYLQFGLIAALLPTHTWLNRDVIDNAGKHLPQEWSVNPNESARAWGRRQTNLQARFMAPNWELRVDAITRPYKGIRGGRVTSIGKASGNDGKQNCW